MDIATLVVAVAALVVSGLAFWASHRSAKASDRSAVAAEQSAADGRRSADAATRSVEIAAEQLEMERDASRPKVDLRITQMNSHTYLLKNQGEAPAPGIALVPDDEGHVQWDDHPGEVLASGQGLRFVFASMADIPTNLRFIWIGQAEPVTVSVHS